MLLLPLCFGFFKNVPLQEVMGVVGVIGPRRRLFHLIGLDFLFVPIGHEDADNTPHQVTFPGNTGLVGENPQEITAVKEGNNERQNDGFQAAPKYAHPKNEGNQCVHHTARSDMEHLPGKQPNGKPSEEVHHQDTPEGYAPVEIHDDGREEKERSRIGNQVLKISVDERGKNDASQPKKRPWINAELAKVQACDQLEKVYGPDEGNEHQRDAQARKYLFLAFFHFFELSVSEVKSCCPCFSKVSKDSNSSGSPWLKSSISFFKMAIFPADIKIC